ncbi:MAG TPA: DOPA 4,5-dioxygenase family protein [Burkholderiaceae bacterium]|nr:DOPA 4,5-dioxygenase family protein [Burkholderiaceae bacterium]
MSTTSSSNTLSKQAAEQNPAFIDRPIVGWHAHVYFDANSVEQARQLCEEAARRFRVRMGRVHERPVGPHPDWSCQLAFRPEVFSEIIPWLSMNRKDLVVFIHPITGNDLIDHRDFAMWMGAVRPLKLSVLSDREQEVSYEF